MKEQKTTTYIEVNLSVEDRAELVENLIPSGDEYKFQNGDLDAELLELKYAYSNLPESIADLYLKHVLCDKGDDETFEPTSTAKEFARGLANTLNTAIASWEQE